MAVSVFAASIVTVAVSVVADEAPDQLRKSYRDAPAVMSTSAAAVIDANFSNAFATVYLLVVAAAIFVCCLAIQASTIRLCFGMSRDEQLPGSSLLRVVHPRLHTPIGACIAVGVFAFIPMLQYTGAAIVAIAATGMIYLSYLICNLAVIRARLRGWPRTAAR